MSNQSPEEIQAEIEQQREQLAGTLDALSAKLDVKSQAQAKVAEVGSPTPERALSGLKKDVATVRGERR